jgi:TatD DNase family protein
MRMLFDTHVNLHADVFGADLDATLARATEAGVTRMIAICDRIANFDAVLTLAAPRDRMWCSVGAHPHHAKDHPDLAAADLVAAARHEKVCGIGETGLDLHYGYSPLVDQERVFRTHIEAARILQLPLIVHTREADNLTGDILEEETANGAFPILLHCYTGGERLAERARDLGAMFSVSGILSFPSARDVRKVIATLPPERILLETDCPYLAPVPHRGRRNEPAFLPHVCAAYAGLMGLTQIETARLTTANALRFFRRTS